MCDNHYFYIMSPIKWLHNQLPEWEGVQKVLTASGEHKEEPAIWCAPSHYTDGFSAETPEQAQEAKVASPLRCVSSFAQKLFSETFLRNQSVEPIVNTTCPTPSLTHTALLNYNKEAGIARTHRKSLKNSRDDTDNTPTPPHPHPQTMAAGLNFLGLADLRKSFGQACSSPSPWGLSREDLNGKTLPAYCLLPVL